MTTLSEIKKHKLVAILRGAAPAAVLDIARALSEGGIMCLEITLNSPGALQAIEYLSGQLEGKILIGAGTVLSAAAAEDAISAGAKFIISPITDEDTISRTKELGAVSIPGAFTPTEIYRAHSAGGDIIKVFPGTSGPGFIREILAPLPYIPLMPTGGINIENINEFKRAGAIAFGIGKSLVDTKKEINAESLQEITDNAKRFVHVLNLG